MKLFIDFQPIFFHFPRLVEGCDLWGWNWRGRASEAMEESQCRCYDGDDWQCAIAASDCSDKDGWNPSLLPTFFCESLAVPLLLFSYFLPFLLLFAYFSDDLASYWEVHERILSISVNLLVLSHFLECLTQIDLYTLHTSGKPSVISTKFTFLGLLVPLSPIVPNFFISTDLIILAGTHCSAG